MANPNTLKIVPYRASRTKSKNYNNLYEILCKTIQKTGTFFDWIWIRTGSDSFYSQACTSGKERVLLYVSLSYFLTRNRIYALSTHGMGTCLNVRKLFLFTIKQIFCRTSSFMCMYVTSENTLLCENVIFKGKKHRRCFEIR
jgi:hypothetical protein